MVLSDSGATTKQFMLMKDYLENLFPNCPIVQHGQYIVLILADEGSDAPALLERMRNTCIREWNVKVGISLEFRKVENASAYYRQAVYAISKAPDQEQFASFYDYALDFLVSWEDAKDRILAIHPDVAGWIDRKSTVCDDNLTTLYHYLLHERSLRKAAEAMYVHRNTLVYRINRISEEMRYDLDDPYTRQYILTSIVLVRNLL